MRWFQAASVPGIVFGHDTGGRHADDDQLAVAPDPGEGAVEGRLGADRHEHMVDAAARRDRHDLGGDVLARGIEGVGGAEAAGRLQLAVVDVERDDRPAPAMRAPWIEFSPTPPQPTTATVSPSATRAVLVTAPKPVMTPQASSEATGKAMSRDTFTAWLVNQAFSAKAPVRNAWKTAPPSASRMGPAASRGNTSSQVMAWPRRQ
jgi:hypothetical protein